jgi:hypothetical protein
VSYTLQGIIGPSDFLDGVASLRRLCCPLSAGMTLVPLGDRLRAEYGVPFLPLTDEGTDLPESILQLCSSTSHGGVVAYVEAEFFGGDGGQGAAVWRDTRLVAGPQVGPHAINEALRLLGVRAAAGLDEFDTVGLGLHRSTDDWLRAVRSR